MVSSREGLATENPLGERSGLYEEPGEASQTTQESDARFARRNASSIRLWAGQDKRSAFLWLCWAQRSGFSAQARAPWGEVTQQAQEPQVGNVRCRK